jgi:hypothetical protein
MNFEEKYLKYKKKYLDLKGGNINKSEILRIIYSMGIEAETVDGSISPLYNLGNIFENSDKYYVPIKLIKKNIDNANDIDDSDNISERENSVLSDNTGDNGDNTGDNGDNTGDNGDNTGDNGEHNDENENNSDNDDNIDSRDDTNSSELEDSDLFTQQIYEELDIYKYSHHRYDIEGDTNFLITGDCIADAHIENSIALNMKDNDKLVTEIHSNIKIINISELENLELIYTHNKRDFNDIDVIKKVLYESILKIINFLLTFHQKCITSFENSGGMIKDWQFWENNNFALYISNTDNPIQQKFIIQSTFGVKTDNIKDIIDLILYLNREYKYTDNEEFEPINVYIFEKLESFGLFFNEIKILPEYNETHHMRLALYNIDNNDNIIYFLYFIIYYIIAYYNEKHYGKYMKLYMAFCFRHNLIEIFKNFISINNNPLKEAAILDIPDEAIIIHILNILYNFLKKIIHHITCLPDIDIFIDFINNTLYYIDTNIISSPEHRIIYFEYRSLYRDLYQGSLLEIYGNIFS